MLTELATSTNLMSRVRRWWLKGLESSVQESLKVDRASLDFGYLSCHITLLLKPIDRRPQGHHEQCSAAASSCWPLSQHPLRAHTNDLTRGHCRLVDFLGQPGTPWLIA